MNFATKWQHGVSWVAAALELLGAPDLEKLRALVAVMMEQKQALQALVAGVDAASLCAGCGGACCVTGKYHFTGVDLLGYLVTREPLFEPLFHNGLCPYLGAKGCLMPPAHRPFNCITFNCELIEELLEPHQLAGFYQRERALRQHYAEIRSLFPAGSLDGALL